MNIFSVKNLRRMVPSFKTQYVSIGLILMYHRVAEENSDPWSLCVTPYHFKGHLEVLRKYGTPLSLQQLVRALHDIKLPNRAVVVTFDDGYVDNLYNAKPILEHFEIPATVFLTTGNIGSKREFWWDELDRVLLQPGILPEMLRLSINGNIHQWELGKVAHYNKEDFERHCYWRIEKVQEKDDPSPRHSLYRSLYHLLFPLLYNEQQMILDELLAWSGIEKVGRPNHHSLLPEEVIDLAAGGIVEVGSHSVTHPVFSELPVASQQNEIQQSKEYLEEILNRPVTAFSYPHGRYTTETVNIVRKSGYACACSSLPHLVNRHSELFQLPRVIVEDWDGEEFERRLSMWFNKH